MARTSTKKVNKSAPSSTNKNTSSTGSTKQPTAAEMREWYEKNGFEKQKFEEAMNGIKQMRDITKNQTKMVNTFSKETLRQYLKAIGSNEKNLRNLSRYLFYRCQQYARLIYYNSNMLEMDARSVIPEYDLVKENNEDKIKKSYQDTLDILDNMNLNFEMFKAAVVCWREDAFYSCCYYDETGMFLLPLDPDYCKIDGIYPDGTFSFCMDMTYFRSKSELLEYWQTPFDEMYREYESTGQKWIHMKDEYACCFKVRAEDWDIVLPPYVGLFSDIISLIDVSDIQATADEQSVYRLLAIPLETLSGSKNENDWRISPDIVLSYAERIINEALPPYVSAVVTPTEIQSINLDTTDSVNDVNKIQKNTEVLFNTSGGAQILNSSSISGTTAFTAAIKADTEYALSSLLPQIEAWVNRFLSYQMSNFCKVKFFPVSSYTKDEFKKSLLNDAQYGLPTKLAINTLNGFSEKETLSLSILEKSLGLTELFVPLNSSHTTSSNEGGRPTAKEKGETRTDSGEQDDDKQDNKK